jgi:asparagine synthase (glutamine-hydrolysing)
VSVAAVRHLRQSGRDVHCFSWTPSGYRGELKAELARIKLLELNEGLKVHLLDEDILRAEVEALFQLDPVDFPVESVATEVAVMRSAHLRGVERLLTGWGGDEVVSLHPAALSIDFLLRGKILALFRLLTRGAATRRSALRLFLRRFRDQCFRPLLNRANGRFKPLVNCAGPDLAADYPVTWGADELLDFGPTAQAAQVRYLTAGFLAERMESWWSHGQRFGLDYAYPLLDRDLLEFVLKVPSEHHFSGGVERSLFKAVAATFVGHEFLAGDVKHDACMIERMRETVLFPERVRPVIEGRQGLVNVAEVQRCWELQPALYPSIKLALDILRRCQWRTRRWDN